MLQGKCIVVGFFKVKSLMNMFVNVFRVRYRIWLRMFNPTNFKICLGILTSRIMIVLVGVIHFASSVWSLRYGGLVWDCQDICIAQNMAIV